MKRLLFPLFPLIIISSCKNKNELPKDILPREKMQEVLWSMILAGEYLNGYVLIKDSVDRVAESSKWYNKVFQVHQITQEQFDKSYTYYREHPALMKVILDSLVKKQPATLSPPAIPGNPGESKRIEDSMLKKLKILKDTTVK